MTGRDASRCESAARELGANCTPLVADISTVDGCRALASAFGALETRLDVLVHNAGVDADGGGFRDYSEAAWDGVMDVNIKAPFFLTQALHPALKAGATREQPAKVINIGSIDAIRLNPIDSYAYYASKSGLMFLPRRLAAELIGDRIVVSCIAPGSFASDMNIAARDMGDRVAARIPSGRIGEAEDMQGVALFLASRAGDWVVGETIIVDGGVSLAKYYHPDPIV